jgi:hypothetical protein
MQAAVLMILVAVAGIAFALWLATNILLEIGKGFRFVEKTLLDWWRKRQLEHHRQKQNAIEVAQNAAKEAEQQRIAAYRKTHPAQVVGAPDLQSLTKIVALLDGFAAEAAAYRPRFIPAYNESFRHTRFSFPFAFFFPRQRNDKDDGPEPALWEMTTESLMIPQGRDMRTIYGSLDSISEFPCPQPTLSFDPPLPPALPPLPDISPPKARVVSLDDGSEIDARVEMLQRVYSAEFAEANSLNAHAMLLCKAFVSKKEAAIEAYELMDVHLANQMLIYKDAAKQALTDFNAYKLAYEQECERQIRPLKHVYQGYKDHTRTGIENHFSIALETLPLPLPSRFPWKVFYDPSERILQINQRVPFLTDIAVTRPDSKRAIARRDSDNFLRRVVPAISLHVAQHVSLNDLLEDVDIIAVNCWCRYFEKTSGKLKNAFLSSLRVDRAQIMELNINKADALDAFRALRGTFVYSIDEVVPIEPQIRLDRSDSRFVKGKEVLDGMAQGQNLATMDWQDFEHLIRELLAKEYGRRDGSEVRITRASRDRGVDAVIFDPDPLHGGKFVVQAKRYNNVVDVSAVRDLWGTVLNEGAARGILVTTSRYGRDSHDFAANKPITLIDGQNLLSLLAKHGYRFKIELV